MGISADQSHQGRHRVSGIFFLLVDDYSRFMWVYFLKSKDEAFKAFKVFRTQVQKHLEKRIKIFRTDRGGEFTSNEFKEYCEGSGIERHLTTPYTPQRNGVEMSRSCVKEMKIPGKMWGEGVKNSVYILNKVPTRALSGQTPYDVWYDMKSDLSYVRVFGGLAYMKRVGNHVGNLDDRSCRIVSLGREPGTKGYRLYDPENDLI